MFMLKHLFSEDKLLSPWMSHKQDRLYRGINQMLWHTKSGNRHIQWRRGSVSLRPVNCFSLLNTNYTLQNNTLLILLVKKSLGSVNASSKSKLRMTQCKTPNPFLLFSNIWLLLAWEHDTEKWLFLFWKMFIALEEPLSHPYFYYPAERISLLPPDAFHKGGSPMQRWG